MANVYFGDTIGQTDENWNTSIQFTVSSVSSLPAIGSTYSNNGFTFKITSVAITSGSGTINAGATGTSAASGTLTKVSGTGDATINFSAKSDVNWFLTPGSVGCCGCCGCSSFNIPGTPLGRLPTLADSVIVYRTISVGPDISFWSTGVQVPTLSTGSGQTAGVLLAGTFATVEADGGGVLGGTIVCNGAVIASNISGGTFTSSVTTPGYFNVSGGTFNGTIVNSSGTTTSNVGLISVTGPAVFNCAIPNNFHFWTLSGGTYDRTLVLGVASPTAGNAVFFTFNAGFSTTQNITLNARRLVSTNGGIININGGVFGGLITINKLTQTVVNITGGSYSPPSVTTPAVRNGNSMTFANYVIPIDYGFSANGTFNATVLLTGTSNEIIGGGLP